MKEQFTKEFAEWLSTENLAASYSLKISSKAAFLINSNFARVAVDLTKQAKLQSTQINSLKEQISVSASDPGNPNQLSGNTMMGFPPTCGPSSQIDHAHMSPTRGQLKTG